MLERKFYETNLLNYIFNFVENAVKRETLDALGKSFFFQEMITQLKTLERAVEMGQKKNMVKAMMEGTEETRAEGNCSSSSSARVVRWAK